MSEIKIGDTVVITKVNENCKALIKEGEEYIVVGSMAEADNVMGIALPYPPCPIADKMFGFEDNSTNLWWTCIMLRGKVFTREFEFKLKDHE